MATNKMKSLEKSDIKVRNSNLAVNSSNKNMRCFTPTITELCSPDLSPLFSDKEELKQNQSQKQQESSANNFFEFVKPMQPSLKKSMAINSTTIEADMDSSSVIEISSPPNTSSQKQQQHREEKDEEEKGDSSYDLIDLSKSINRMSDSSNSTMPSILNHTLSVTVLLKNVGLEEYAEKFSKAGIDLDKFMNIEPKDLKQINFSSEEHYNKILDLLTELNGNAEA